MQHTPRRLLCLLVVSLLSLHVSAVCYLEDTSSTCSVCWVTVFSSAEDSVGVTKMTACPENIVAAYDTALPMEMFEQAEYPVTFSLQIDPAAVPVTPGTLKDGSLAGVPHANIHSCIASRGACTPFVSNTPGLSTHTPASTGDFDAAGKATFDGLVNLDIDTYIIIAHVRFFTPSLEAHGKPTKYDVAVGVQRTVMPKQNEVSADAYIMAGVVGFMILLFGGAIFYMVNKGILDLDRIMQALFSDVVTLPTDIVCGMADAAAFTISCTVVLDDQSLLSVVPICWLFCGIAWVVSTHNMFHDLSYMKMMFDEKYNSDKYQKLMMLRMSKKFVHRRKSISADLNTAGKKKMARRVSNEMEQIAEDSEEHRKAVFAFDMADRDFQRRKRTIASILLESLPITTLQTYILVIGDSATSGGVVAVLALLLAALLLGCKLQGLGDYGHAKQRREQALQLFDKLFQEQLRVGATSSVEAIPSAGGWPGAGSRTPSIDDPKIPSPTPHVPSTASTGLPIEAEQGYSDQTAVVVMEPVADLSHSAMEEASNLGWTESSARRRQGSNDIEAPRLSLPGTPGAS